MSVSTIEALIVCLTKKDTQKQWTVDEKKTLTKQCFKQIRPKQPRHLHIFQPNLHFFGLRNLWFSGDESPHPKEFQVIVS